MPSDIYTILLGHNFSLYSMFKSIYYISALVFVMVVRAKQARDYLLSTR
jgi:hypothetical protein